MPVVRRWVSECLIQDTVRFPRFLMEHAMLEVFPLMPMTVLPGPCTKYGPEREPVGLGVTLS